MIGIDKHSDWVYLADPGVCIINPVKKEIAHLSGNTRVSFIPMSGVSEEGEVIFQEERLLNDVIKGYTYFKEGDVLFAKITPCMENGKSAIAKGLINGVGFGTTEFHVIRPGKKVIPEWIYYFIRQKWFREKARNNFTGSAGQKRVPASFLKQIKIPLPSIPIQKKIANILETAESARKKRREAIHLTDEFLKSTFLEMFGDPFFNEKEWPLLKIEKMCSHNNNAIKAGPFGSSLKKEIYVEKGYKIYGQEQVIRDDFEFGNYYISESKYNELENYKIQTDDILISLVGTYGKISIVPRDFEPGIINPRLMKITLNKDLVLPIYFKFLLESEGMKARMNNLSHGGTMGIINIGIVKSLRYPIPPKPIQKKFSSIVETIHKLQEMQCESEKELDNLFNSLMQKAFRGELFSVDGLKPKHRT